MDEPPKSLQDQVHTRVEEYALAPRAPLYLERPGEPLPVLEAFQEFLELERQRTRRRFWALMAGFAAIVLLLGAGGIVGGYWLFHHVDDSVAAIRADVSAGQEAARTALDTVASKAAALRRQLDAGRETLAGLRARLEQGEQDRAEDLDRLRELVTGLEVRNDVLETELAALKTAPAPPAARFPREPDLLPDRPLPALPGDTLAASNAPLAIRLPIPGRTAGIPWRLPLPE
ncbi:MAG: hypothetical protein JW951_08635 [Lentisphaerae bacterium]|nr:hypothetical protein [Lentisphaerota bacterium]